MDVKSSCIQREPLSKLEENGSAAILNYNLPQATSYEVVSYIRLDVDPKLFRPREQQAPKDSYWDRLDAEKKNKQLNLDKIAAVLGGKAYSPLAELQNVGLNIGARTRATKAGLVFKAANIPVTTQSVEAAAGFIANRIDEGFLPHLYRRPSGRQGLRFLRRPKRPRPSLYLCLRMRMSTYLGDYGAGQTLSTFSLLPGEKTVIEVRDYRHNEETRSASKSVLDSYSESAMDELQTTVEERTEQTESTSETDSFTLGASGNTNASVTLGVVELGGAMSGNASTVSTTVEAVNLQVSSLTSSVDHHVQTADTARQIEINTGTTSTEVGESEKTTTRTLENVNRSRVLNFVFRQLLQEFYSVTYLHDVSLVYSNGYPDSRRSGTLSSVETLLRAVLIDEKAVQRIKNRIYEHLCNIPDHTGARVSFIEPVREVLKNCIDSSAPPTEVSYVRKRQDLVQRYKDRSFKGIVLDVSHRIMRTPAVIVDALLGQGEALDCYNQELQEAAYTSAHLKNRQSEQAIAILEAIADPAEKARLYKKVFGDCCDSPQSVTTAEA